ncbi:hypothetical protein CYY_003520 [Polysphondylium violaceum]|uniref:Rho-GAP domain-containing protein n=1 Tax=Polysphondylium violaceum TaxID=133409 RepID=A0A8J4PWP6_9MYCE|nr:hypothetical protein CYY_003520 [Polysphondylium violaceum]
MYDISYSPDVLSTSSTPSPSVSTLPPSRHSSFINHSKSTPPPVPKRPNSSLNLSIHTTIPSFPIRKPLPSIPNLNNNIHNDQSKIIPTSNNNINNSDILKQNEYENNNNNNNNNNYNYNENKNIEDNSTENNNNIDNHNNNIDSKLIYTDINSVPNIIRKCIEYITSTQSIYEEGLLRVAGSKKDIQSLREEFQSNPNPNLTQYDAYVIGDVLKQVVRERNVNQPLISYQSNKKIIDQLVDSDDDQEKIDILLQLINPLPLESKSILLMVFRLLQMVASQRQYNKMSTSNLSMIFSQTLLIPPDLVDILIKQVDNIFM